MKKGKMILMYKKLREWIKYNSDKAVDIKLSNIDIVYDIHQTGKFKPSESMYTKVLPCVVKQSGDRYILIANWYAYTYFRYLNLLNTKIKCIIVNRDRNDFFNYIENLSYYQTAVKMNINDIIIPKDFITHKPKDSKINSVINYYNKYKIMDKSLYVNPDNVLMNGYIRYLALVKLGVKEVTVEKTFVEEK